MNAETDLSSEWTRDESSLLCQLGCTLRITDQATSEPIMNASVTHIAVYLLGDGLQATDQEFGDFATVNAAFSLYPYLRESLQNLTVKGGLPPYILPPLRSPLDRSQAEHALAERDALTQGSSRQNTRPKRSSNPAKTKAPGSNAQPTKASGTSKKDVRAPKSGK